jgi:uncharacterized protein (UPF0332 family)
MNSGDYMGTRPEHIRKAQHNDAFLKNELLKLADYNDWKVIAIFYSAVHYVDAALAVLNIHPINHQGSEGRNTYVSVHFRRISGKYQTLYNKSRFARYTPDSENQIDQNEIQQLLDDYLERLKTMR